MKQLTIHAIKVRQPIGDFFVGVVPAKDLFDISSVDVRKMANEGGEVDRYLGIQRTISENRIKDLVKYVGTHDATFPTSIIVAVPGRCATWDEEKRILTLSEYEDKENPNLTVTYADIAKILDGQHRLKGLAEAYGFKGLMLTNKTFDLNVAFFIEADPAMQATIFATVNLAQTKVNKSLVYDLAELSKIRSPQKSCHYIAVALDSQEGSPFCKSIKRLGVATTGRGGFTETLTQATFVESLIPYLSSDPLFDREFLKENPEKSLPKAQGKELRKLIFRNMYIEQKEVDIAKIIWAYFAAVKDRWPDAWENNDRGNIIKRTNGFKAFMKFLRPCYLHIVKDDIGRFVSLSEFVNVFKAVELNDNDFNSANFPPGTSGESKLFKRLLADTNLNI